MEWPNTLTCSLRLLWGEVGGFDGKPRPDYNHFLTHRARLYCYCLCNGSLITASGHMGYPCSLNLAPEASLSHLGPMYALSRSAMLLPPHSSALIAALLVLAA